MARPTEAAVLQWSELGSFCAHARAADRRLVLSNGCFDLLHRGHMVFLRAAAAFGDVLIVGVNDDASVRGLKGQGRPLLPLADRLELLAAIRWVDAVVPFSGETADALIECVRPAVYVKGSEYHPIEGDRPLPERATLARLDIPVRYVPIVPDHSSTGLANRARQSP
jgi:D-beta-D-heptose 7-phosphate kinase/D-beta-D-heptose 1-phosphate adenosyltransferase